MNKHYGKLFSLFSAWLGKQDYSTSTQETYLKVIGNFLANIDSIGVNKLKNVSEKLLTSFITTRGGKTYAQANINLRQSAVSLFYGWAYANRYCLINVMLKYKKTKLNKIEFPKQVTVTTAPSILTPAEQLRLISIPGDDFIAVRNKCIVSTILVGGLYAEEIIGLLVDDVDLDNDCINCNGRKIPIDLKPYHDIYQNWAMFRPISSQAPESGLLFLTKNARPLTKRALYRIVSETMTAAGINAKQLGPDILRRTAICNMFVAGKTIEEVSAVTGIDTLVSLQRYCGIDCAGSDKNSLCEA